MLDGFLIMFSLPLSIWFIWPFLHVSLGTEKTNLQKINTRRKQIGVFLLCLSAIFLSGAPLGYAAGFELGFFYWLFSFMALAIFFLLLRVWHPMTINIVTAISCLGGAAHVIQYFI